MQNAVKIQTICMTHTPSITLKQTEHPALLWVQEGDVCLCCPNQTHTLLQGDIAFLPLNHQAFCTKLSGADVRLKCLYFPLHTLQTLSSDSTNLHLFYSALPFVKTTPPSNALVFTKTLLNYLETLLQTETFGVDLLVQSTVTILLVKVLSLFQNQKKESAFEKTSNLNLDALFLYIRAHLSEEISLTKLESVFFMSHEHIAREFKRQTGLTIHKYILNSRLEQSHLLLHEGFALQKVWKICGFNSYEYFIQAFKKKYGTTPKNYFV